MSIDAQPCSDDGYTIIDSDAHVVETERTWQYMAGEDEKYRPVLAAHPTDRNRWVARMWIESNGRNANHAEANRRRRGH